MKIGVIHWAFPPVIGGVEMHLLTILPEMVKQGEEVYVLTSTVAGTKREETVKGVQVTRREELKISNLTEQEKGRQDLYSIGKELFEKFIQKNKIDLIKAHNLHLGFPSISRALVDACEENKIPRFLVLHNDFREWIDNPKENIMWDILNMDWDALVPISWYIQKGLLARKPQMKEKSWKVILHGIDLERFKPVAKEEKQKLKQEYGFKNRPVILHPARISYGKGSALAIASMSEVKEKFPDSILVLTGKSTMITREGKIEIPPEILEIEASIGELKIEESVHVGNYGYDDIPRLSQLADVLVYPTLVFEPFGLCPVEGMACRVPAIVTRSGGLVESVVDGVTGYIIEKEKVEKELPKKIIELLSNQELREKMGKAGRKRAEEIFDKKRMAKDFIALAEKLVKEK